MARRVVLFDPAAVREAHAAYVWYRSRNEAAARGFADELDVAIEALASTPRLGTPYLEGTRRILFRRYPFSVVYRETPDWIEVIAVAHTRRRPGYWSARGQACDPQPSARVHVRPGVQGRWGTENG